ncbi:MAG: glycerol kinase GlpK, partial [Rickettsiales bacterium]|nr:glycerol kinase GlpK [Rickettsiales bacterium]
MKPFILSIDQGTTSSRAIAFAQDGSIVALHQEEYRQIYPHNGWVEHDPEAIWATTVSCCQNVIADAKRNGYELACIGITNQRETTVVWDKDTGKPVYNAIVWQDRRTSSMCLTLKEQGCEPLFQQKTGLVLDPYFSGTKLAWILDHAGSEVRKQAVTGKLAFGTVDSFLLWRLANNAPHYTDATNASRTLLFNIHTQKWDVELLDILNIPSELLPDVKDSMDDFGCSNAEITGSSVPINSMIGDQHAAMIGQGCFKQGTVKATYGTGCFVMAHTGQEAQTSKHQLLTTMAYRLDGNAYYAIEGSIFIAGAAMQWLRDGISILNDVKDSAAIANELEDADGVVVVPSFTGIGAPYWQPDARGAILGMTRDSGRNQIIRATLESVAYQTYDLFDAMSKDGIKLSNVYVDGGMSQNEWLMGYIAALTSLPICRRKHHESTALGAAFLAGIKQ